MTNAQEIIARNTSQVMSSMDQNYAMYDGQQQKQQVDESFGTSKTTHSQLYRPLNQIAPIMSSAVCDFRIQAVGMDSANLSITEKIGVTRVRAMEIDEELKNQIGQISGHVKMEGGQHNALQQGQHPSTTFQQLQAQLQKQQQQLQRTATDVTVPGSISGTLPLPLPASIAAARAAGDVVYPALPQPSNMLAATQEALAERRAAVAAAVAAAPERAAAVAAAAAAAAKKLPSDLQNMGLIKPPGSPPPADARTPPPTLASLAALHVEPPPPYISNPSLAAYRNAMMLQQPYSAHLASLMNGLTSSLGHPAYQGASGISGVTGIPGMTGGIPGVTPSAVHPLPSLPIPTQIPGLAHLTQPQTNLQMPTLPPLPSATLAPAGLPPLALPVSAPQTTVTPAWQNVERENPTCHSGICHASQPMAVIPVAMPFPMHMHSCCSGPWMPSPPILWAMSSPTCYSNNGAVCSSAGACCQMSGGQAPTSNIPLGIPSGIPSVYPVQRPNFPMPNSPIGGIVQTGPPGYRIPANLNTRNVATSTLSTQQLPEKPKAF